MQDQVHISIPFSEKIKGVAGFFGIRTGEEPEYMLIESDGNKEVRSYLPYVTAHLEMTGEYQQAMETAFQELSDYIFGKNASKVQMEMTAPVIQEKKDSKWIMSIILPEKFNLANAPSPENKDIKLEARMNEQVAVIEYSGINSREKVAEKKQELINWLTKETGFVPASDPRIAQYDPPMAIPFMRRNEIQIPVKKVNFKMI